MNQVANAGFFLGPISKPADNTAFSPALAITEGFELADAGVSVKRAIIGGTDRFQRAKGEARQTLLGISEQMGVSLQVQFRIRR